MKIFNAYIDGFNLYMGALKGRPDLKWLDLVAFCQAARPDMQLGKIYFFTAAISERYPGDDAPRRQEKYLRVLANQGINVVRGKFRKDKRWLRIATDRRSLLISPPLPSMLGTVQLSINLATRASAPDRPKAQVIDFEEKGSDVNLASHLLRDSYLATISAALVITGDSDLVLPILFAEEQGINVKVLVPNSKQNVYALRSVASRLEQLHRNELSHFQLPKTFVTSSGRQIVRPKEWA